MSTMLLHQTSLPHTSPVSNKQRTFQLSSDKHFSLQRPVYARPGTTIPVRSTVSRIPWSRWNDIIRLSVWRRERGMWNVAVNRHVSSRTSRVSLSARSAKKPEMRASPGHRGRVLMSPTVQRCSRRSDRPGDRERGSIGSRRDVRSIMGDRLARRG